MLEEELIKNYNDKVLLKEKLILESKNINKELDELKLKIDEQQALEKLKNSNLRSLEKDANDIEIKITKTEIKMDNMLNTLKNLN